MSKLMCIILMSLCLTPVMAADTVPLQARVQNPKGHGVCFWACVETIGRTHGIAPLYGLTNRVIREGVGRDNGATEDAVEHWFTTLGIVKHRVTSKHSEKLAEPIRRKLQVITSMNNWYDDSRNETHAIIVTGFADKQQFTDHRGVKRNDNVVEAIDPNKPNEKTLIAWTWFWNHWNGTMTWIDPADQDKSRLLEPSRLMLASVNSPAPKTGIPAYQFPQQSLTPIRGYLQPEVVQEPINVVTNDLQDGIHRPYDTMFDASYRLGHSHSYYINRPSP